MISVISPRKYGDNERSILIRIGSSEELVFKDFIRESTMSCVGSVKHDQLFRLDVKLRLSRAEFMFRSILIILEIFCWKKLANKEQITDSGWSGRCLVWVLPIKVKYNV